MTKTFTVHTIRTTDGHLVWGGQEETKYGSRSFTHWYSSHAKLLECNPEYRGADVQDLGDAIWSWKDYVAERD